MAQPSDRKFQYSESSDYSSPLYLVPLALNSGEKSFEDEKGWGLYPTFSFEGVRSSTSRSFVHPVEDRINILTNALTSGLIVENNQAKGIKVVSAGRFKQSKDEKTFYAGMESKLSSKSADCQLLSYQ